jgi:hypothetical protein
MRRCRSKIYALVLALAALVVVSLAPRQAKACGGGGGAYGALAVVGVLGAGLVVTDVVFTGYDLVQGVSEERASKGMAVAEVAVTTPQFVLGGLVLSGMPRDNNMIAPAVYVAWTGTLMIHGMVTLATQPKNTFAPAEPTPAPDPNQDTSAPGGHEHEHPQDHPHISVAPAMLSDGMRSALIPGLSAVGRF